MKNTHGTTGNPSTIDDTANKPVLRYMVSILLCLIFYFPVTFITAGYVKAGLVHLIPSLQRSDLYNELFTIVWRTLMAYLAIVISVKYILNISLAMLLGHLRAYTRQFMLVFVLFVAILLGRDWLIGALYSYAITFNVLAFSKANVGATLFLFFFGLLIIPVHALAEEIVYRALPIRMGMIAWKRSLPAIGISAILFWLNHGGAMVLYWMCIGIALGILVVKTKTIIYSWGIHAAFNFYNAIVMNSTMNGDTTSTAFLIRHSAPNGYVMLFSGVACVFLMTLLIIKWEGSYPGSV